jgi:hypothetical protein
MVIKRPEWRVEFVWVGRGVFRLVLGPVVILREEKDGTPSAGIAGQ